MKAFIQAKYLVEEAKTTKSSQNIPGMALHLNPLLYNKGNIPKETKQIVKNSESWEEEFEIPDESFVDTKNEEEALNRQITNNSIYNEESFKNVSEFEIEERNHKVLNMFQLPIFETHNATPILYSILPQPPNPKRKSGPLNSASNTLAFTKSKTVKTRQSSFETLETELTEKQYDYLKLMYAFKENYLLKALSKKEIFLQYISLSKADFSFTKNGDFLRQQELLLKQRGKYNRDEGVFGYSMKTLILDLDETIIFTSPNQFQGFDTVIISDDNQQDKRYVKLRPFLNEFLGDMSKIYEIIVYTAAEEEYADKILDFIEREHKFFSFRLYKNQCLFKPKEYMFKHLGLFCENRNPKQIVIIDNMTRNFALSIRNGIPIIDFTGQNKDNELPMLGKYLRELASYEDFCNKIKEDFAAFLLKKPSTY